MELLLQTFQIAHARFFPYSMILFLILDSPSVFLATLSGCFKAAEPWVQASHIKSLLHPVSRIKAALDD